MAESKMAEFKMVAIIKLIRWISLSQSQSEEECFWVNLREDTRCLNPRWQCLNHQVESRWQNSKWPDHQVKWWVSQSSQWIKFESEWSSSLSQSFEKMAESKKMQNSRWQCLNHQDGRIQWLFESVMNEWSLSQSLCKMAESKMADGCHHQDGWTSLIQSFVQNQSSSRWFVRREDWMSLSQSFFQWI